VPGTPNWSPIKENAWIVLLHQLWKASIDSGPGQQEGGYRISAQEVRQIAKEAYIYDFPLVANYETLHKQAVDTAGSNTGRHSI